MTDFMTPTQRSHAMSRVRSSETELERVIRSELHRHGFRFRKNVKGLPGRPDVVLPKYGAVVFVHGCFWHGHEACPSAKLPDANAGFWREKIAANIERDRHQVAELRRLTWRVGILWGCALQKDAEATLQELISWLRSQDAFATIG